MQSSDFAFATFFVYDSAGNPVWYTGELHANNAHAAFSGNVYRTQSAPASNVLSPTNVTIAQVGTATFQPSSATRGTIELRLDQQTLTKDLQRLTLTAPPSQSADTATYAATITTKYETEIAHKEEVSWSTHTSTITFTKTGSNALLKFIDNNGATCTITGPLEIEGRSYEIDDDFGRYICIKNNVTLRSVPAELDLRFTPTGGLEGSWSFEQGNYEEEGYFSAVLQSTP